MKTTRVPVLALVLSALVLAGCGGDTDGGDDGRPTIVAAFYPLAFVAERIGGDLVDVANVTPTGAEPHDIEITPDQVDRIEDADLVLYIGGGFQPAIEDTAGRQGDRAIDVLDVLDATGASADDPHVWLDPRRLAEIVTEVSPAIASTVTGETARAAIETNTEALLDDLRALDDEMEAGLQTCEQRAFVTSHDAFGLLAERYDLEQLSIAGLSPESEPSPARLEELSDEIEARGITTVFYEDLVAPDVAETLANEVGVETAVLSPLEGLTAEQVESGEDYLSVMRANLEALRQALRCS
jgi:zinc transport system substrate-binding protein